MSKIRSCFCPNSMPLPYFSTRALDLWSIMLREWPILMLQELMAKPSCFCSENTVLYNYSAALHLLWQENMFRLNIKKYIASLNSDIDDCHILNCSTWKLFAYIPVLITTVTPLPVQIWYYYLQLFTRNSSLRLRRYAVLHAC